MTESVFRADFPWEKDDFDACCPRPGAVMRLFQQAAARHAEALGVGREELLNKNIVWVVVREGFSILSPFDPACPATVETWPLKSNGLVFERDFTISQNGETKLLGTSQWALMDVAARRMTASRDLYGDTSSFPVKRALEHKLLRLREDGEMQAAGRVTPTEAMTDENGHVNNTFYPFLAQTARQSNRPLSFVQVDFHRELKSGEEVRLYARPTDDGLLVRGNEGDFYVLFKENDR